MDEETQRDLKSRLEEVEKVYALYEKDTLKFSVSIREVDLDIHRETLMSMDYRDIQGLCFDWAQYNLALTKEINKHQSRYNWAHSNLERVLEKEAPNDLKGFTFQEKKANVLNGNEYAQKLHKLKEKAKLVIDRLNFIPQKIEFLIKIGTDIAYTKKKYERNDD